jgi:hypothetical protein
MNRYTKIINTTYAIDDKDLDHNSNGYYGPAVDKLAEFENIIDDLLSKQDEISKELELLRKSDQKKSYKFRDALGHKLINSSLITIFKEHNLM